MVSLNGPGRSLPLVEWYQQQWPGGPNTSDLRTVLRVLSAMKDHTKAVINANLASWTSGYDTTSR